jgi:hypothetical protein
MHPLLSVRPRWSLLAFGMAALLGACGGGGTPAFEAGSPAATHAGEEADVARVSDDGAINTSGVEAKDRAAAESPGGCPGHPGGRCVAGAAPRHEWARGPEPAAPGDGDGPKQEAAAVIPSYVVPSP